MRKINKHEPPTLGLQERRQDDAPFGWGEIDDDTELKNRIKTALLEEQGYLCAYTGVRVEMATSHVEHMRSRNHDWGYDSDTDYHNMLACYPKENGKYGAHKKENWPSPEEWREFVSPLEPRCERCFEYRTDGSIQASGDNEAAKQTILHLRLDHPELAALRRGAVRGSLEAFEQQDLQARRNAILKVVDRWERRMQQGRPAGRLKAFIFVLVDALRRHADALKS